MTTVELRLGSIQIMHKNNVEKIDLKTGSIEFKYYADAIHSGLTPPG